MTRHFLVDTDLTAAEQEEILDLAVTMKANPFARQPLAGVPGGSQTVAVIFDKTSTRTRVSFSAGVAQLGGNALIINPGESQIGHKESIADSARVLDRMVCAIVWRTFGQDGLAEMAAHSRVPVINALSDDYHPCQLLADLLTIREHKGPLPGLTLAYLGDAANNMANSFLLAGVTAGMNVRIAGPQGYLPQQAIIDAARARAMETGGSVLVTTDASEALAQADVVATDTWVSMGQEEQTTDRRKLFTGYALDADAMDMAAPDAIVLHCLPAYRGYEIAADVLDGPRSVVWDEAENRLHVQKALLTWLLAKSGQPDAGGAPAADTPGTAADLDTAADPGAEVGPAQ